MKLLPTSTWIPNDVFLKAVLDCTISLRCSFLFIDFIFHVLFNFALLYLSYSLFRSVQLGQYAVLPLLYFGINPYMWMVLCRNRFHITWHSASDGIVVQVAVCNNCVSLVQKNNYTINLFTDVHWQKSWGGVIAHAAYLLVCCVCVSYTSASLKPLLLGAPQKKNICSTITDISVNITAKLSLLQVLQAAGSPLNVHLLTCWFVSFFQVPGSLCDHLPLKGTQINVVLINGINTHCSNAERDPVAVKTHVPLAARLSALQLPQVLINSGAARTV